MEVVRTSNVSAKPKSTLISEIDQVLSAHLNFVDVHHFEAQMM
ncbi:hypothetical protein DW66_3582 [Pseudomonas putida]|nr:hypothetical protein DW66_3582 [Pseudomonas putida]